MWTTQCDIENHINLKNKPLTFRYLLSVKYASLKIDQIVCFITVLGILIENINIIKSYQLDELIGFTMMCVFFINAFLYLLLVSTILKNKTVEL